MKVNNLVELNKVQAEYYNDRGPASQHQNFFTKTWWYLREKVLAKYLKLLNFDAEIKNLHLSWLGEISDKKVLDFGCGAGNPLSLYLATNAGAYVAVDLSKRSLNTLKTKFTRAGLADNPNVHIIVGDILVAELPINQFDIIYANGVLHHFNDIEVILKQLKALAFKGGSIITYDPLQTSPPIYIARKLYRPFQSDAAWEWPFEKKTFAIIKKYFEIQQIQGFLGRLKWGILLKTLPLSSKWLDEKLHAMHQKDMQNANKLNSDLFACMHVAMKLTC